MSASGAPGSAGPQIELRTSAMPPCSPRSRNSGSRVPATAASADSGVRVQVNPELPCCQVIDRPSRRAPRRWWMASTGPSARSSLRSGIGDHGGAILSIRSFCGSRLVIQRSIQIRLFSETAIAALIMQKLIGGVVILAGIRHRTGCRAPDNPCHGWQITPAYHRASRRIAAKEHLHYDIHVRQSSPVSRRSCGWRARPTHHCDMWTSCQRRSRQYSPNNAPDGGALQHACLGIERW